MIRLILFTIVGYALYSCGSAMSAAVSPDQLTKSVIIDVQNRTSDELFVDYNTWIAQSFRDAKSVIDFSDKEAGRIVGKYVFEFMDGIYSYYGQTTITLDTKDNKARIVFADPMFQHLGTPTSPRYNSAWQPVKNKIVEHYHKEWDALANSLRSMLASDKEDW